MRYVALSVAAFLLAASAARAEMTFRGLGHLPGAEYIYSSATAVSADGSTVVGESRSPLGSWECEAFRWTAAEGMVSLGFLTASGTHSTASGVSADGSVVVGTSFSPAGEAEPFSGEEPFRWTRETGMVGLLPAPGSALRSIPTVISLDGSVVLGLTETAPLPEVFRWTAGAGIDNPGLPGGAAAGMSADGSVIVGSDYDKASAYRWTAATGAVDLGNLPGNTLNVFASDVSADGSVVVGSVMVTLPADDYGQAFRWTEATGMATLGPIEERDSYARAISADGSIVVGSHSDEAFIWDEAHGMRDLYDVLTVQHGLDLTGWRLQWANDISADGRVIVGYGTNPAGYAEAWMAVVPETSSLMLALVGVGLLACAAVTRRAVRCARQVTLGAAVLLLTATAVRTEATFQGLGHLPEPFIFSAPLAVSADGSVIVGESRAPDWQTQAFRWTAAEGMEGLGFLTQSDFSRSLAYDVSADGAVIVGSSYSMAGPAVPLSGEEAFVWTRDGGMVPLFGATGGAVDSRASVVSGDGSIVLGTTRTSPFPEVFRWTADRGVHDPGLPDGEVAGISADGSAIAGTRMSMETVSAYLWTEATGATDLGPLPGQVFRGSFAQGLSADGSVVVGGANVEFPSDPYDQAFRWTREEGLVNLAPLVDQGSVGWAASADGAIVVGNNFDGPFLWDQTHGLRMLEGVLTGDYGLDLRGWRLEAVTDISSDGRVIVGYGVHNGDQEAWRVVVPEPSSLMLALAGGLGFLTCTMVARGKH